MEIRKISDHLAVSAQIVPGDLEAIKASGIRAIICNRPDGEDADQPSFREIAAAARTAGLETRYVPVQPGMMDDTDVVAFLVALKELPHPVLAYCRSGTRSATLWSLRQSKKRLVRENMAATKAAG